MERDADRWERPCEQCLGEKCGACGETGWVWETQRPTWRLSPGAGPLFQAYRLLKEYKVFPVEGGQMKQSAVFLAAIHYCDLVHTLYAEKKKKEQEQKDKVKNRLIKLVGE